MLLTKGAKTMFIIVFTMINIVVTIIYIVFTKIGNIVRHPKYAWVNCYIIAKLIVCFCLSYGYGRFYSF